MPITLFLDLDGVLITTPIWKPDPMDTDGYSMFNLNCVKNFNDLLKTHSFEIWLSSTRRTAKTITQMNSIFHHRGITQTIHDYLPQYPIEYSRKDELETFIKENNIENHLIIDDDKSLRSFSNQDRLILTEYHQGFDVNKLEEAKTKAKQTLI